MATISTVSVDFVANVAKYTQGLAKIQSETRKFATDANKQFKQTADSFSSMASSITRVAGALAAVAGIARFSSAIQQATKDISLLADEAEKVGASAEQFSRLQQAIKQTGGNITDISKAYIELRKSINEANTGNKETIKSFYSLGLSIKSISDLDPDTRFLAVASALSKVSDANERARLGTALLGKSYNELAPLIDKGVASLVSFSKFSIKEQDIQKIDALNKKYEQLGTTIDVKFKQVIIALEPALTAIANALTVIVENAGKVSLALIAIFGGPLLGLLNRFGLKLIEVFGGKYLKEFATFSGSAFKAVLLNFEDLLKSMLDRAIVSRGPLANIWGFLVAAALDAIVKIKVAWAGLVAFVAASGFSVFGALTAAVGAFAVGLVGGLFVMNKILLIASDIASLFNEDLSQSLKKSAQEYQDTLELLVSPLAGDTSGLTPEILSQRITADALQAEQAARKAAAGEREFTEALQRGTEEAKKFNEQMQKLADKVNEDVRTPLEKAQQEVDDLTDAFYFGYITQDAYNKRLQQIKNSTDALTAAQLSLNEEMVATNESMYAQAAAQQSLFGQGIKLGIGLPKGAKMFDTIPMQDFAKQEQQRLTSLADTLKKDAMTAEEVYAQRVIDINAAAAATDQYGRDLLTVEQQTYGLVQAQKELDNATMEVWKKANPEILLAFEYMSSFADQFARAIAEGQNFGDALKNVFKSILRDITVLIIRSAILQGIMASLGFINPAAGAAFGQLTGLVSAGNRADGGPVMGGSPYRVGERGPETFVPAENGYILPNDMPSGETVIVNQTINVQTGVAQTVRAEMLQLLPRFKSEAMAGVLDAKQRGGSYAKGLSPI